LSKKTSDPIQSNPIQPNPWMNPIHVQLCVCSQTVPLALSTRLAVFQTAKLFRWFVFAELYG